MSETTTTSTSGSAEVQGDLWSERADDWANLHEHRQAALHQAGLDQLGIGPGISLLDAGCGSGTVLRAAADRGADVSGLDAAPAFVEHARRRVPDARIEVGDLESLPFQDASFDVVTGFNSFQYASDPRAALKEARRVLRHGGKVLVAIWGRAEQCDCADVLGAVGALMPPPGTPGPFALAAEGALSELVESAGFATLAIADVATPIEYPDQETYVRAMGSAGPCVLAARIAGRATVDDALVAAAEPFQGDDGSYRFANVFRFAVARVR
ncbi:MAG: class I SAM-dependent methyltransferase [Gaiellaceae bacterium]